MTPFALLVLIAFLAIIATTVIGIAILSHVHSATKLPEADADDGPEFDSDPPDEDDFLHET